MAKRRVAIAQIAASALVMDVEGGKLTHRPFHLPINDLLMGGEIRHGCHRSDAASVKKRVSGCGFWMAGAKLNP